jgi:ubiquinone/menaquinone biosynthesis methyltransferase
VPREQKPALVNGIFQRVAPYYDRMNDVMSTGLHRVWKNVLVKRIAPKADGAYLDVAGGTGDVAFRVLDKMRVAAGGKAPGCLPGGGNKAGVAVAVPGAVTVYDISPEMLEVGKRRAGEMGYGDAAGNSSNLTWVEGDAERLPFGDDSFDAYTIVFGIRNVTDRAAALKEARRVLKPGGRFYCLELSKVVGC